MTGYINYCNKFKCDCEHVTVKMAMTADYCDLDCLECKSYEKRENLIDKHEENK